MNVNGAVVVRPARKMQSSFEELIEYSGKMKS
jgi:hypothetical protein